MALIDEAKLAQRFDLAIMSSKGMSVVAARELADEVCHAWGVPLFILRDFDKAGFSIRAGFMQKQSRRYTFKNQIKVHDLGPVVRCAPIRSRRRIVRQPQQHIAVARQRR